MFEIIKIVTTIWAFLLGLGIIFWFLYSLANYEGCNDELRGYHKREDGKYDIALQCKKCGKTRIKTISPVKLLKYDVAVEEVRDLEGR